MISQHDDHLLNTPGGQIERADGLASCVRTFSERLEGFFWLVGPMPPGMKLN
jgi:hypothetical protein